MRDASEDRWDSQPFTRVDLDDGVFHPASLRWYRDRFHATNPGFEVEQPHHDFLYEWGYPVKDGGKLLPTRGAVALFGSLRGVRNLIPKPGLDVRFVGYAGGEDFGEARWIERLALKRFQSGIWLTGEVRGVPRGGRSDGWVWCASRHGEGVEAEDVGSCGFYTNNSPPEVAGAGGRHDRSSAAAGSAGEQEDLARRMRARRARRSAGAVE